MGTCASRGASVGLAAAERRLLTRERPCAAEHDAGGLLVNELTDDLSTTTT